MSAQTAADNDNAASIADTVRQAMADAEQFETPYRHWLLKSFLPEHTIDALLGLDVVAPALDGVSGKRELHNDQRTYFDAPAIASNGAVGETARAFQSAALARDIAAFFGADIDDTLLRIEYAVDRTGFWLQPHTDLGVKRLTILHYISDNPAQHDCGTDIFNADKSHAKRTPFARNLALAFVPGAATYHGFVERPIAGLRKSLIINYVTQDWRDREQLCFPDQPLRL